MATAGAAEGDDGVPIPTPFPARSKTKTTSILDVPIAATGFHFSDKILITLSQNGRLGHWVYSGSPDVFWIPILTIRT